MANLDTLIAELAAEPEIRRMAAPESLPLTQHSYGHYLSVIGRLADREMFGLKPAQEWKLWALVLIEAGADSRGVRSALRVAGFGD